MGHAMGTAQAAAGDEIRRGALAPDMELRDSRGAVVLLSSFWDTRPLVLLFLNDLTSELAADQLSPVRNAHREFEQAGAAIVVAVLNRGGEIDTFKAKYNFSHTVLSDRSGEAHLAYTSSEVGSFVVDTNGVVRYAHRAGSIFDTPPVFDLIDVVCELTGEVVERPQPGGSPAPIPLLRARASGSTLSDGPESWPEDSRFTCGKCGHNGYETVKIATSGGWLSRVFNFQYRKFVAVVCTHCNYAELYRSEGGTAGNIADLLIGG